MGRTEELQSENYMNSTVRNHAVPQVVGRLKGLAGGRLLALGDEGGGLSVADLRMLGGTRTRVLPVCQAAT